MTKKERIAELERKVAELEADRLARQFYIPAIPSVWANYGQCPYCGQSNTMGHVCWRGWSGTTTVSTDTTTVSSDTNDISWIGAA